MYKLLGLFLFMSIWVFGCYLQDTIFHIDSSMGVMAYGFMVGTICKIVSETLSNG